MSTENIDVKYGQGYSDCTHEYIVTLKKPMTIGEFIGEWVMGSPNEWGNIVLCGADNRRVAECSYRYGQITKPMPEEHLDKQIKIISGQGGWSLSDFWVWV